MYLHHCYLLHHIYIVIIYIICYFPGFQLFIAVSSLWRLPYVISILQNWEPWHCQVSAWSPTPTTGAEKARPRARLRLEMGVIFFEFFWWHLSLKSGELMGFSRIFYDFLIYFTRRCWSLGMIWPCTQTLIIPVQPGHRTGKRTCKSTANGKAWRYQSCEALRECLQQIYCAKPKPEAMPCHRLHKYHIGHRKTCHWWFKLWMAHP
jgi:hypothetical protein